MANSKNNNEDYGVESIRVIESLSEVRERPGIFVGDTRDGSGLHHMVCQIVADGIDEIWSGNAIAATVTIHADNSVTVSDNGCGLPVHTDNLEAVSCAEVIMTKLHPTSVSTPNCHMHPVVNALSDWLELRIWRDGKEHFVRFEKGEVVEHLKVVGDAGDKSGTEIRFFASADIFSNLDYQFDRLERYFNELAGKHPGVRIVLTDERPAKPRRAEFFHDGPTPILWT